MTHHKYIDKTDFYSLPTVSNGYNELNVLYFSRDKTELFDSKVRFYYRQTNREFRLFDVNKMVYCLFPLYKILESDRVNFYISYNKLNNKIDSVRLEVFHFYEDNYEYIRTILV